MKKIINISLLVFVMSVFVLSACTRTEPQPPENPQQACEDAWGDWKQFQNTCVNSCAYRRGEVEVCGQALTMGCECGSNMCWNGNTCVEQ